MAPPGDPVAGGPHAVLAWLRDGDPGIRWQVLRDLEAAPAPVVAAARARCCDQGLGAEALQRQQADGTWRREGRPAWLTTLFTLQFLRALGVDPADPRVAAAINRLQSGVRWNDREGGWNLRAPETGGNTFFEGEEEPCINGGALAVGAYFGRPAPALARRLLDEQLPDGGWNCAAPQSRRSSFHTTLCVLEGLLAYEHAVGGDAAVARARRQGEEYLLVRGLFRRLSTGAVVKPEFLQFSFPPRYHYDVLRALDHFRAAGGPPDGRVADAVAIVAQKMAPDGRWGLEAKYDEGVAVETGEPVGGPSRWNTLRALRVLRWHRPPAPP